MPPSRPLSAVLALACAPALLGQQAIVVPSEFESADAPGIGDVAGVNQAGRQQVLVRAEELRAAHGREIVALWLRRDVQLPLPLVAGRVAVAVFLSDRAAPPGSASEAFADNRGAEPVEVFRGDLEVPAAPAPQGVHVAPWAAPHAIEIPFARPFRYEGGNLCVEIEARLPPGEPGRPWLVDHALAVASGTTRMAGRACDLRLQAMAVWTELAPGSRVTMLAAGPAQTTGVCLLGRETDPPLDLSGQGAKGCFLHVDPFAALPFLFPRVKLEQVTRVEVPVVVPALPALCSARFAIQWLQVPSDRNPAHIATTHVQVLSLAHGAPSFAGATVRSGPPGPDGFPERGQVQTQTMPVLRFVLR